MDNRDSSTSFYSITDVPVDTVPVVIKDARGGAAELTPAWGNQRPQSAVTPADTAAWANQRTQGSVPATSSIKQNPQPPQANRILPQASSIRSPIVQPAMPSPRPEICTPGYQERAMHYTRNFYQKSAPERQRYRPQGLSRERDYSHDEARRRQQYDQYRYEPYLDGYEPLPDPHLTQPQYPATPIQYPTRIDDPGYASEAKGASVAKKEARKGKKNKKPDPLAQFLGGSTSSEAEEYDRKDYEEEKKALDRKLENIRMRVARDEMRLQHAEEANRLTHDLDSKMMSKLVVMQGMEAEANYKKKILAAANCKAVLDGNQKMLMATDGDTAMAVLTGADDKQRRSRGEGGRRSKNRNGRGARNRRESRETPYGYPPRGPRGGFHPGYPPHAGYPQQRIPQHGYPQRMPQHTPHGFGAWPRPRPSSPEYNRR